MGEHKRNDRAVLASAIGAAMVDRGKLIEDGFAAFLQFFYPTGVGDAQRRDLRMAWFLASDHLFFGVMGVLSAGTNVTERDIARMAGVNDELLQFRRESLGQSASAPGRQQ